MKLIIFKQVLNISDIGAIIKMQRRFYPADIVYDYFCEELEAILKATFCTRDFSTLQKLEGAITLKELVRSSLLAFANKIYVKKKIYNRTQIISGKDGINK